MAISPLEFFSHLRWIDERPLLDVIEPYRQRIFTETLYTFGEGGVPHYNLALTGRGKKNWKSRGPHPRRALPLPGLGISARQRLLSLGERRRPGRR